MPAVSIVTATASRAAELGAEEGAAEAVDDEERVVDPEREREHEREVHRPDRDLEAVRRAATAGRRRRRGRGSSAAAAARRRRASRRRARGSRASPARRRAPTSSSRLRFALLKSLHIPEAPVSETLTPARAGRRAASTSACRRRRPSAVGSPLAPAITMAVCPSAEMLAALRRLHRGDARVGAQDALDACDRLPERRAGRRLARASGRRPSAPSSRGRRSCAWTRLRACTDSEPFACQPAPESARLDLRREDAERDGDRRPRRSRRCGRGRRSSGRAGRAGRPLPGGSGRRVAAGWLRRARSPAAPPARLPARSSTSDAGQPPAAT